MRKCEWLLSHTPNAEYLYDSLNGLVLGQCHPIAHSVIYMAKVWITPIDERIIGQFVSMQFAKSAVESFWEREHNTLTDQLAIE